MFMWTPSHILPHMSVRSSGRGASAGRRHCADGDSIMQQSLRGAGCATKQSQPKLGIASLHPAKSVSDSARNDVVRWVLHTHGCRLPHELQHEIALGAGKLDQKLLPRRQGEREPPDPIGIIRLHGAIDRADEVVVVVRTTWEWITQARPRPCWEAVR